MKSINTLFKLLFLFVFTPLLISSCMDDVGSECYYEIESPIISVIGPETVNVGEEIVFQITFLPQYGCNQFKSFHVNTNENIYNISITTSSSVCNCSEEPFSQNVNYTYTPQSAGTYTFKFSGSNNETSITKDVIVE